MENNSLLLLPPGFKGIAYRLADCWYPHIPISKEPITYLEIGVLYGANALSVAETYAKHDQSIIYCVDPWLEYKEDTDEISYDNIQDIFKDFLNNLSISKHKHKFNVYKNFSHEIVPTFNDNMFDIIYIDGNHGQVNVLEDAVITFRKLKLNGYLIFDDVGWRNTNLSLDTFYNIYKDYIKIVAIDIHQFFIQKIKNLE